MSHRAFPSFHTSETGLVQFTCKSLAGLLFSVSASPPGGPAQTASCSAEAGSPSRDTPEDPRNVGQVVPLLTLPPSSDCAGCVSTMFSTCWSRGDGGAWAEPFPSTGWLCHTDYMVGKGGLSALLGYRWWQEKRHCPRSALRLGGQRPVRRALWEAKRLVLAAQWPCVRGPGATFSLAGQGWGVHGA